jgi:creatinine amidohydrolase
MAGQAGEQYVGHSWYANFPEHYAGDACPATAEKGEKLQAIQVAQLAKVIAAVKADAVVPALDKEFFERGRF